jgi:Xaa-Pro aminopeptidase
MIKIANERLGKLRKVMVKADVSAILVSNQINRNYLSGFTGTDCIVLVTQTKALFITDFRYTQQAKKQVLGFKIIERPNTKGALQVAIESAKDLRIKKLGFESSHLSYQEYEQIRKWGKGIRFIPTLSLVEKIRLIKDDKELSLITKSQNISTQAFKYCLSKIKLGMTEKEIALIYEEKARRLGADTVAFDTIVASSWRSALPHGVASEKKIKKGELLTIDFGVVHKQYNSDCTRTFILGTPTRKQKEIYQVTLEAQLAALDAVKPGASCKEIDIIARNIITKAGYGKYFGHGLGHGVGMEIHEGPRLSQAANATLEPGMVVTVEPGIYLENIGGVRIEDLVIVTKTGHRVLTTFPKELISLAV